MPDPLFGPEIRLMLADEDTVGLQSLCEDLHPARVADALDEFSTEEILRTLRCATIPTQAAIFEYLPLNRQIELVEAGRQQIGQLLGKMSHDDRVDLLRRLPLEVKDSLLRLVNEADRKDIATLFDYPEHSVGAVMTTDYSWLPPGITAADAIEQIRQQAPERETIYYIYVLEDTPLRTEAGLAPRKLLGVVSLRDLILAHRNTLVRDLMTEEFVSIQFDEHAEKAAQLLARFDFIAIPVLDAQGGLLGIITHDDVIDVITEEATEDLQRQAAVGPIEGNYLEVDFRTIWINRAKWLAILFIAQMVTINVMNHYESELEKVVFLMAFVPLCLSVGGNTGSQAATLVTRALALGQITVGDWFRVFRRELLMGVALALVLGVLSVVRTWVWTPTSVVERIPDGQFASLIYLVTFSVMGICLCGTLIGSMLPLFFKWLGVDPALTSSPFIATLSDVLGIVIFFNITALLFF